MVFDSDDSDSSDCDFAQGDQANTAGQHEENEECLWKSATDPKSGKTYYYHIKTRETQWRKPIEMASREERDALAAKEKRQKDFFSAMEANILKSISAGMKAPEKKSLLDEEYENKEISDEPLVPVVGFQSPDDIACVPPTLERRSSKGTVRDRPDLVRTISTMDTSVLRELIKRVPSTRQVRPAPPGIDRSRISMSSSNHSNASTSVSGRSLVGGSSHQGNFQRRMYGIPGRGAANPARSNLKKSINDDSSADEPPPLTVVTTPDLRYSDMKRMNSLKLENLRPERADSLRLDQLSFDGDSNQLIDSSFFGGSNGLNFAESDQTLSNHTLSNPSLQMEKVDSQPPDLMAHNSRSSFAGAESFSSFDSSQLHINEGFDGDLSNSRGHLSIASASLHPVEEGMDESEKSFSLGGTPGNNDPKEIVLKGRDDLMPQENSFSLGTESDAKEETTANWLDGLPDDDEESIEEMVGYGKERKPYKNAGFTSFFDESMANFDLSEKETEALQKLALISEQMTHVMESEEDSEEEEEDSEEEEDDDEQFGEEPQEFELNFEGSDEESLETEESQETEESSLDNDEPGKSSPSFQTPITASSRGAQSGSPLQSAQRRTVNKLGDKNIRVPRAVRNKLKGDGEESEGSSSEDDSLTGNVVVPSLKGAMLTTDNPRSHLGAALPTLTTDNARSHFGAKPGEGSSSSSLNNVSGHSADTGSSSQRRPSLRIPKLNRQDRQKSRKGGISLGSPDLGRPPLGSPMSQSTRSHVAPPQKGLTRRPDLVRRNTCGTLYVGTTMSAPDKDATMKCVCGVYRAHILQSELADEEPDWTHFRIFNDLESQQGRVPKNAHRSRNYNTTIPSLDDITTFYRDVFQRAQMEYDCIIISLIYVERLVKTTNGALRPRACNWRSILFSCMVLASKVWDDLSMWNADFSQTCPSGVKFPLKRINELEVSILSALSYKVKVPASEYAKYYFLLRTMLIKSGLVGDTVDTASPLDVEGAKRLQQMSTQYQSGIGASRRSMRKAKSMRNAVRSKSMGEADKAQMGEGARKAQAQAQLKSKVSLERVVQM